MTSKQQSGLSTDRVDNASEIMVSHLQCSICHNILWKPVACQSCETPFCSSCINKWLVNNPNKCPNRCKTYTERKCPPFIAKLLAQLTITCFYKSKGCRQAILYEALDKHETECGYQPEQCPGCQSEILKSNFENHKNNCAFIQITCEDCKLVYKRGDANTKHTENICLKEQLRQFRNESKEHKREIYELNLQLKELFLLNPSLTKNKLIFDDLPTAAQELKAIPSVYRRLKWKNINYGHESYLKKNHATAGYVTCFMSGGSPHIAYFVKQASISVEHSNQKLSLISITVCAAWNDDLQLTITGYQNSVQNNTHTATLLFGKPQIILLNWKDIDEVIFIPSGGTGHPGNGGFSGLHVVITQITIDLSD